MGREGEGAKNLKTLCWALVLLAGCAPGPRSYLVRPEEVGTVKSLAILPFENMSAEKDASRAVASLYVVETLRRGVYDVADPGRVDKVLEARRIRDLSSVDAETLAALGEALEVQGILAGAVVEYALRTRDGKEIPVVGVSTRLIEPKTGRILWVGSHFRDGADHETVFGWGRETSLARVAQEVVSDLVGRMTRELASGKK